MASRQDRAQAHQLARERAVAAVVVRDSDPPQVPFRGAAGAALASVLIAAVAVGAVAAWARYSGGGSGDDGWRDPGVVIVEAETGAAYLWRDPLLHPVANYTSAQLLLADPAPPTVTVERAALDGVPRGPLLGIPGAPGSLPPDDHLVTAEWTVCAAVDAAGPHPVLAVGGAPDPAPGADLADRGLLAQDSAGAPYLVWQGRRYRVRDPEIVLPALGWAGTRPAVVAEALLRALPSAPDLGRVEVPHLGEPAAAVPGARVGEVFRVASRAGEPQYAVALTGGLALLTPVQVDILLADPRTASVLGQREPAPLSAAELAALPRLDRAALPGAGWPAAVPALVRPEPATGVCVVLADGPSVTAVSVTPVPLVPSAAGRTGGAAWPDARAGQVWVPPGRAALVSDGETVHVVTDVGVRHPVTASALPLLGYGEVVPVRMPAPVVDLIPVGPTLDPGDAHGGTGPPADG